MKNEHIVLKVILIVFLSCCLGFSLYFDIPERVIEYYNNSLNKHSLTLLKDERAQLKLKKKEGYSASSSNPKIVKIDQNLNVIPLSAGKATITVSTRKQKLRCKVTIENKSLNPMDIYLKPGDSYQLTKPGGTVSYTVSNELSEVSEKGLLTTKSTGTSVVTAKTKSHTYVNTIHCANVLSLMKSDCVTVYDATTQKYLYTKNSETRMNPASITKILTVYTCLSKIKNVNAKTTLTSADIASGSYGGAVTTGILAGESVTYNDMLYGALLVSGADAVKSLERTCYGSTAALAAAMNENASEFGMTSSHFTNGIGMTDASHYTTGKDIVKLLSNVLKNKRFTKIFYTHRYKTSNGKHVFKSPAGGYGSHVLGAKNGLTNAAANCVALNEKINGHMIYIVTMHASTPQERKSDIRTLNKYLNFEIQ